MTLKRIKLAPRVKDKVQSLQSQPRRKGEPAHRRIPLHTQFTTKFYVSDIYPTLIDGSKAQTPCWVWTGATNHGPSDKRSYPVFGRPKQYGHRYSYEHYKGPIPDGKVVDHMCRRRLCVNPDHLQAISNTMNLKLGAHPNFVSHRTGYCAARLHDLNDPANVYLRADGRAFCKKCSEIARGRREQKKFHTKFRFVDETASEKKQGPKSKWGLEE